MRVDPIPAITVAVDLTGGLCGPVTCVVAPELARSITEAMLESSQPPPETIMDAAAELTSRCSSTSGA